MKRMLMKTLRRPNRLASLKCTDKNKKKLIKQIPLK